jgi:hypothetical protein
MVHLPQTRLMVTLALALLQPAAPRKMRTRALQDPAVKKAGGAAGALENHERAV